MQDAAALLGVSVNTLRKRIRAGQVQAERVQRPQGYVWQVYLDTLQPPDPPCNDPPIQEAPSRLQQPPQALMQAEAMAAYTRSLLEPLVATIERQADQLVSQAKTIGRKSAEIEALRSAQASPASSTPLRRLWGRWWPILAVLMLWVVIAALVVWTR